MTDIVERLRALGERNAIGEPSLAHQAAAEIERLRAEVETAREAVFALVQARDCGETICTNTRGENCECRRIENHMAAGGYALADTRARAEQR